MCKVHRSEGTVGGVRVAVYLIAYLYFNYVCKVYLMPLKHTVELNG